MKNLIVIMMVALLIVSCRKETQSDCSKVYTDVKDMPQASKKVKQQVLLSLTTVAPTLTASNAGAAHQLNWTLSAPDSGREYKSVTVVYQYTDSNGRAWPERIPVGGNGVPFTHPSAFTSYSHDQLTVKEYDNLGNLIFSYQGELLKGSYTYTVRPTTWVLYNYLTIQPTPISNAVTVVR